MADNKRITPAESGPFWGGLGAIGIVALTYFVFDQKIPALGALAVVLAGLAGLYIGKYQRKMNDHWIPKKCHIHIDDLRNIENYSRAFNNGEESSDNIEESSDVRSEYQEGIFLSCVVAFFCLYLLFFIWCSSNNLPTTGRLTAAYPEASALLGYQPAPGARPPSQAVVEATRRAFASYAVISGTTAMVMGLLLYHAAHHALFVRLVTLLAAALRAKSPNKKTIRKLKASVFRHDQLYEPAGNVFVTVGIMATFLGLAVGLATTDLSSMAKGTPDAMVITLSSIITCMGLGLGVSMLGVIIALLAQSARGHGPRETTDQILEEAAAIVAAPAAAEGNEGDKVTEQPKPGKARATTRDKPAAV